MFEKCEWKSQKYKKEVPFLREKKDSFFFLLQDIFATLSKEISEKFSQDQAYKQIYIQDVFFQKHDFLLLCVKKLNDMLRECIKALQDVQESGNFFSREIQEFTNIKEVFECIFDKKDTKKYIYFLKEQQNGIIELSYTLLETGSFLKKELWDTATSVLLTSATLFVSEENTYMEKMLGTQEFMSTILASDFDYQKQALVYIPQDL